MPSNASASADGPRTLRRSSLARRVSCDAELPTDLTQAMLRGDPERVLLSSHPLQVKDRCVVARYESPAGPLLVKRHAWGDAWRTLRMAFREPAARRCARLGQYLHGRGIPTPRPRAYADFRLGPWTYRSYLVSDFVEGESLYRYIRFGSQAADELRRVAEQVAGIWQTLVELGVSHNDMKPENFIVDLSRNVWLIDLEKVRIRGNAKRQLSRQVFDVKNFLHVRGWHHRADARAIFADAFLRTPYGEPLTAAGVDRLANGVNSVDGQTDQDLSVLILCDGGIDMSFARQAIDSVRDIADEVVLVEATESKRLNVLKRIELCDSSASKLSGSKTISAPSAQILVARHPWILCLQQNECVTPFLAKELQQRIADERAGDAFRIPIERQVFGRSIAKRRGESAPVRLFRSSTYRYKSLQQTGDLKSISADAQSTAQLTGTIQVCVCATVAGYVDRLNEETTLAAKTRLQQGERPRLGTTAWLAAARFIQSYVANRGFRNGWTGLQTSVLEAVFRWVEEAKLHQLAAEFNAGDAAPVEDESTRAPATESAPDFQSWRAKAA